MSGPLKNARRERFCQEITSGASAAEAYRRAYGSNGDTAKVNGSRLLTFADVNGRLSELRAPVARQARVTVQSLLDELRLTIEAARKAEQHGVVVSSLTLAAKLTGLLTERLEVSARGPLQHLTTEAEVLEDLVTQHGGDAAGIARELRELADRVERYRKPILIEVTPNIWKWPRT
ncbi:terminase small subunit [Bradyrhizobium sp. GCM10027634]|uniref:terminase small subunit n=1 Tax=unclassified Bradyrhizobium TaxID=2631580 RepID=UPI00188B828B|nr:MULTISPECIES: terminase small subunit [unclassified Bradyrhizobium]MDN5003905.1 terminase small subunit [Bradyrhizobium sp. WYCCWR 12677]QOZ45434.1 hypothetical protein XH89_19550 [Bradyrhizobium sp. CCBAU 53340]